MLIKLEAKKEPDKGVRQEKTLLYFRKCKNTDYLLQLYYIS